MTERQKGKVLENKHTNWQDGKPWARPSEWGKEAVDDITYNLLR